MPVYSAYILALIAAVAFSGASVIYARFSHSHSSLWMNLVKNSIALLAFAITSLVLVVSGNESWHSLNGTSIGYFCWSGFLGLGIGDLFLFQAFRRIGSARTLLVFSFAPILLSIEGFLVFGQDISMRQGIAIVFMLAWVWVISFEKFKENGHWEWRGILYAIIGVILDNLGVVLSRKGFDLSPGTSAFTANVFRCMASVLPLLLYALRGRHGLRHSFQRLTRKELGLALGSPLLGTYLSLSAWLTALKVGHIGSLAAVGSFNPVSAALWEWALQRKRPSSYLLIALGLFLLGFFILIG